MVQLILLDDEQCLKMLGQTDIDQDATLPQKNEVSYKRETSL